MPPMTPAPEFVLDARRLAHLDALQVAMLLTAKADRGWLRELGEAFQQGRGLEALRIVGLYDMGRPTLIVQAERAREGPRVPARAAVVGVHRIGGEFAVSAWTMTPGRRAEDLVKARRLT